MDKDRWDRMWSLFHAALEHPEGEQTRMLEEWEPLDAELRGDVQRLLASHSDPTGLLGESPMALGELGAGGPEAEDLLGQSLGCYRLVEVLGHGGMGVVYRAEQKEPIERSVALKVIRFGMQSQEVIARFEIERQALAIMDHPGIARLFDAGITRDGRPYFAMEAVAGVPITEYADRNRLAVPDRVRLFARVCRAVEHAHQKGVLHRDLKPSNILVSTIDGVGQPKIIDFGIAKAIDQGRSLGALSTLLGRVVGTPEYMSPEQAARSRVVDTRSDVYSLGVTLYELLVGELPFSFGETPYPEVQRVIQEVEAPRASTRISEQDGDRAASRGTYPEGLRRALSGELDWILLKALDKDRDQRYGSAAELAADLQRYLAHEPVLAAAPGMAYRSRKFARRHRAGVVAALAVVLALLIGLATTLSMAWVATKERRAAEAAAAEAERSRDRAEKEAEVARAVQGFLQEMLAAADPSSGLPSEVVAREVRIADLLDHAADRLDGSFEEQPEVEAALHHTLGRTYAGLGLYDAAEKQFEAAIALRTDSFGEAAPETLESQFQMAALWSHQGRFEDAENRLRDLLALQPDDGEDSASSLAARNLLNDVLLEQGRLEEAAVVYRETLERSRRSLGADHDVTLQAMNNLALVLRRLGAADEAVALYRESLARHRHVLGEDHPNALQALNNLGAALLTQGEYDEAERLLHESVRAYERVLGPDHSDTLRSRNNLGALLFRRERWVEAEEMFREVLAGYGATLEVGHPLVLVTTANIARALAMQDRRTEAEVVYRELLVSTAAHLPPNHPNVAVFEGGMGVCLFEMQRYSEAEPYLLSSYRGHRKSYGDEHPRTIQGAERLADLYEAWDRGEQSQRYRALADVRTPEASP